MVKYAALMFASLVVLAGCAGNREAVQNPGDYVEIDNPAVTMSPGAPPTIWVPRSYVEKGIPRGSEVIERGVSSLRGSRAGTDTQQAAPQTAAVQQAPPVLQTPVAQTQPAQTPAPIVKPTPAIAPVRQAAAPMVRQRVFTLEAGQNALQARFVDEMKKTSGITMIDTAQAALVSRYAAVGTAAERSSLSRKLQEDFGAHLMVYLAAPDGVGPGKTLTAEVYEVQGGTLVRKLQAQISDYSSRDTAARDMAVLKSLRTLALEAGQVAALVPWYGRVVSVDGDRIYINAGKESGLGVGMVLNLYRNGKIIEKLGYAPGQKVAIVEVRGFVGTDGAFAAVKEGGKAQVSDLVGFE